MRTDQLVALVRRHAKLAFKEGRATQKRDKVMARRWCQLRVAAFEEIVKEVDPYSNSYVTREQVEEYAKERGV